MNETERRIRRDVLIANIVKQRLLDNPNLEEYIVRYKVREDVYKGKEV